MGCFLSDIMAVKGLTMTQFLAEETIIMTRYAVSVNSNVKNSRYSLFACCRERAE